VPQDLSALSKLEWLALSGNRLTGTAPVFLGGLDGLKGVHLEGNALAGPLPQDWCANNASYSVEGNANLCGASSSGSVEFERGSHFSATAHSTALIAQQHPPHPATHPTAPHPRPLVITLTPGIVPACLELRGLVGAAAVAGTFLLPSTNLSWGAGGYCDDSLPTCDLDVGCRCVRMAGWGVECYTTSGLQ